MIKLNLLNLVKINEKTVEKYNNNNFISTNMYRKNLLYTNKKIKLKVHATKKQRIIFLD